MKTKTKLLLLTLAMVFAMTVGLASAATMSASLTAPAVDGEDIANYGTVTWTDKWWTADNQAGFAGKIVHQGKVLHLDSVCHSLVQTIPN